jgi:hypothetical protein
VILGLYLLRVRRHHLVSSHAQAPLTYPLSSEPDDDREEAHRRGSHEIFWATIYRS